MALYAFSDTHLSQATDKPMDVFGSRWSNYTEKIKERWNATVTDSDTVVIAGDISWAMTLEEAKQDLCFLDSLPGTKLIAKGNHDYWWATLSKQKAFFEESGITTVKPLYNNAYKIGGVMVCGSRGWFTDDKSAPRDSDYNKIVARETDRIRLSIAAANEIDPFAEKLMFLHFPPAFGDYVCTEIVDCLKENNIKRCYYGHIHGKYDIEPVLYYGGIEFSIISADYLDFTPKLINN